jgi:head-tail adaptor
MRAYQKGRLSINTITFTQDSVGGVVENHTPVIENLRFISRQSSKNESFNAGKFGVETETIFYVKLRKSIDESNFSEKDYLIIGEQCWDIRELNIVRDKGNYGAEIRATKRK